MRWLDLRSLKLTSLVYLAVCTKRQTCCPTRNRRNLDYSFRFAFKNTPPLIPSGEYGTVLMGSREAIPFAEQTSGSSGGSWIGNLS